jgi:tetratricopeptide (TPR) repeat protein
MAVAPLVVLIYDRTFVAGTLSNALRLRRGYYAALAATWLLLGWLVLTNGSRAGTAGFGAGISPIEYALTQSAAIPHYLRLAFWPSGLVFDYGTPLVTSFANVALPALVLLAMVIAILLALRRWPAMAFLGLCFFLILAPSSSIVPVATQTIAEHRMYLPLAALTIAVALGLQRWLKQRAWVAAMALALPLAAATHLRNRDYRSAVALWSDTVAKRPENSRAHVHLGTAFAQENRHADAIAKFEAALRLAPDDAEAHNNLALALTDAGRAAEALPHLEAAVRLKPNVAAAQLNLANALLRIGRAPDALACFAAAERLAPFDAAAHYNYGVALAQSRQFAAAIEHFRATLATDPTHVGARVNLANVLLLTNRAREAIAEYEAALRLRPDDSQIRANLALARRQAN